jgi:hypothetical protein
VPVYLGNNLPFARSNTWFRTSNGCGGSYPWGIDFVERLSIAAVNNDSVECVILEEGNVHDASIDAWHFNLIKRRFKYSDFHATVLNAYIICATLPR